MNANEIGAIERRLAAEPRLPELDFVPARMRAEVVQAQRMSESFVAAMAQLTALISHIRSLSAAGVTNRLRHS